MYKTIIKTTLLVLFSATYINTIGQAGPAFGWAQVMNGNNNDQPTSIAADSRNGVYCYGNSNSTTLRVGAISLPGSGGTDIFLVKYDTLGVLQWSKRFGNGGANSAAYIATDINSNIIITGNFVGTLNMGGVNLISTGGQDVFIAKFSPNGNIIWARGFTGNATDEAGPIICDNQSNCYTVGKFTSTNFSIDGIGLTNGNTHNLYYCKLNSNGNASWAKRGSSASVCSFYDIESSGNGQVTFIGKLQSSSSLNFSPDPFLPGLVSLLHESFALVTDINGNFIRQLIVGNNRFYGSNTALTKQQHILFGGQHTSSNINTRPAGVLYQFNYSNFSFVKSIYALPQQPPQPYSTSVGYDVVVDPQNRVFQLMGAVGTVSMFPGQTTAFYGFASVLWELDSALNPKNILPIQNQLGFGNIFTKLATDTITGKLYITGYISKATAGGNYPIGANSLPYDTLQDVVVLEVGKQTALRSFAGTDTSICVGDSLYIGKPTGATGGRPPYTYAWSPSTDVANPMAAHTIAKPTVSRSYVLTVTDSDGSMVKDTIAITVKPRPAMPTITVIGSSGLCLVGDSATLVSSSPGGSTGSGTYMHDWYRNGNFVQRNVDNPNYKVGMPGVYSVSITEVSIGCSSPLSPSVTITGRPNMGPDTTVYQNCYNDITNLTQVYNTTGLTAVWNTANPTAAVSGVYRLIVSNTANCTDTVFVTVKLEVATWTGAISSDWNTPGNWSTNKVPSAITHVIIASGTPNNCTISSGDAQIASLQLRNGAVLNTGNSAQVIVVGNCAVLPPG